MIQGDQIRLRLVREADLEQLADFDEDISNRGEFFPVGFASLPTWQDRYGKAGLWEAKAGTLIIADAGGGILGHIEFFETVNYLDELELSYIIYSREHFGRGIATEAVRLLSGYLFAGKRVNRIRLIIHPNNRASRRVAEKSGFTFEGVARGAWFHQGRNHDVEVWSLLRTDHDADV